MTSSQIATVAVVAVVGVAVVGGGLAYAARDAEPGDMLYNLRASLYGDVAGDADVQASLDGAREAYEEAQDLERRGLLTDAERARVTASYTMHVNAVLRRIADLEADGDMGAAAELRTDLRAALREYDDVFPNVGPDASSSSSSVMSDDAGSAASASSRDATGGASSPSGMEQNSSIFVQPSSSVTSA